MSTENLNNAVNSAIAIESGNEANNASSQETLKNGTMDKDIIKEEVTETTEKKTGRKKKEYSEEELKVKALKEELQQAKKQAATSLEMPAQIMKKNKNGYSFKCKKYKFALLKENRPITKQNVDIFTQIIQAGKYDDTQSINTMEATAVIRAGYRIMDLEGNAISEQNAKGFLVVLEGQHRISAFAKLNTVRNSDKEKLIEVPHVYIREDIEDIKQFLLDLNNANSHWDTGDRIAVATMASESELLSLLGDLVKDGYNPSTAAKICTGKKVTKGQIDKVFKTGEVKTLLKENETKTEKELYDRAKKFVTVGMAILDMKVSILTVRYFIDGFNSFAASLDDEIAFDCLSKLTIEDFKGIKESDDFVKRLKSAF